MNELRRWWRSAGHAFAGIAFAWRTQPNFRIECLATLLALTLAVLLKANVALVALCCGLVLALELLNTALEAVVDLCSPEFHPLAKVAKDTAAGAVLVASAAALVVGVVEFVPPLLKWL